MTEDEWPQILRRLFHLPDIVSDEAAAEKVRAAVLAGLPA